MGALNGRVAWITGSSRGIGAAIARRFAREGARVAVHGRDEAALAGVLAEVKAHGEAAIATAGDVTRFAEVERMRGEVEERLGPIDVLVLNAGGSLEPPKAVEETSEEVWSGTLALNLTSAFFALKSVLPGMKARRSGTIITISSAAARRPSAHSPIAYAAAKAGLQLLTQDVAAQVGPHGIRASCIAPETILTERNEQRIPAQQRSALVEMHPLKRLGTPEDVASAAVFLASDESAWITGVVVDVAGGSVLA
jgi:3-oxoacyl-[acyl-carrier protein] reductase